jgi:hypothetical protein|tara:strand:- start:17803 stop:18273 length:471 start_codon:yes stop_codon:yes gene_type:complete
MTVSKAVRVKAEMRRYQILDLVIAGKTEREIAKAVNIAPSMVHKDIKKVLSDQAKKHDSKVNTIRALENERYNSLLDSVWDDALAGDESAFNKAVTVLSRIDQIHGLNNSVNLYDQRQQMLVNSNAPVTFRIADDDNNVQAATVIPETESGDIFEA